jgi:hypothetical protein
MHCTTLSFGQLLHIQVDHTEPKMEIQAVQVQWRIGGPRASSDEDTNLVLDQGKPRCIPPIFFLTFLIIIYITI